MAINFGWILDGQSSLLKLKSYNPTNRDYNHLRQERVGIEYSNKALVLRKLPFIFSL